MPECGESKSLSISQLICHVPEEIKQLNNWAVYENKIPIDIKTKRPAKSNTPSTWGSFQNAINLFASNGYHGVGFFFSPPYVGVDIDKSIDLSIPRLINSYTEYSPSGNGIHVICKGTIPKALKLKGLEVYTSGRFFTVTGRRIEEFSENVEQRTTSLQTLYAQYVKEKSQQNESNWVEEKLANIEKGNIHNTTISILGKFRRDGWSKEAVKQFVLPVIERIDGDKEAFEIRLNNVYDRYQPERTKASFFQTSNTVNINYHDSSVDELLDSNETTEWVVKNIIPKNSITFISGLSETRKSWMLLDLAMAAALGTKWLKVFEVSPQKVLLIDQERAKAESTRRLRQLIAGGGLDKSVFTDKLRVMTNTTINLSLDNSFEAFKKKLAIINPTLVLVDSFVTFHGADENHRSSLQVIFERIKQMQRELDLTFVFLDHESKYVLSDAGKSKEPNAHDMIGSSGKVAAAESVLTVRKNAENSSIVYHTKSTCGPALAPFVVTVEDKKPGHTEVRGYIE